MRARITLDVVRRIARGFPGTEEGTSYGTAAFRAGKRLLVRRHDSEDAWVMMLASVDEQQALIAEDPLTFFITDHYRGYAAVLVRPTVPEAQFRSLLEAAWRRVARKRDLAAFDGPRA
ncbi:MAG: MmcQ/YjbR family DNA-binding protein [Pseudomonadales bacterium]|nr:MmcQ/YjbR family DNA-binding protein [Pseudomonadales bacterium]